ncbi:hypothetical protein PpBr36_02554 [Pyricularia pennisetigena]|uniref:hypothetical protein n=1 Tax=Pyricularia pennisetigena TaxID=1578925 RepID=UPI001153B8CD|nr:hypothetical protein PpBr36_02554 [Pyricularia pennisetigena]TLS31621.1 hypothetical protein PpBr36_02554 [Pyricularia pennisetigena]
MARLEPVATAKLRTESHKVGNSIENPPHLNEYDVDATDNGLGKVCNAAWKEVKCISSAGADGRYLAVLRDDGALVICHVERGDGRGQVCHNTGEKSLGKLAFPVEGISEVFAV